MSNFSNSIYDTFGHTDTEVMKRIADSIGGQFKNAGTFKGQQISTEYNGIKISYDIVTISRGGTIDTKINAEFKSHVQYHFVMNTKIWLNFYINIYGWKAAFELHKYKKISLNDDISSKLAIRGTDEKLTANLFDEKAIKVLKNLNVHTFQIHCSSESGKIYAMLYGGINDMDAFLKVHHMICSLIDNMKTMKMIDEK